MKGVTTAATTNTTTAQPGKDILKIFSTSTQSSSSARSDSFDVDCSENGAGQCCFEGEEESNYFSYYESGPLKLLDACRAKEAQDQQQKMNERKLGRCLPVTGTHTNQLPILPNQISSGVRDVSPSDQEITIDDAVKSIVNSRDSWAKVRERIRSRNLVTNQGVFEVCLSYFQEEADRLQKERIDEARRAEAELSKISRLRRRLSLF